MKKEPDALRAYSLVAVYGLLILWVISAFAVQAGGPIIAAMLFGPVAYYLHNSKRNG